MNRTTLRLADELRALADQLEAGEFPEKGTVRELGDKIEKALDERRPKRRPHERSQQARQLARLLSKRTGVDVAVSYSPYKGYDGKVTGWTVEWTDGPTDLHDHVAALASRVPSLDTASLRYTRLASGRALVAALLRHIDEYPDDGKRYAAQHYNRYAKAWYDDLEHLADQAHHCTDYPERTDERTNHPPGACCVQPRRRPIGPGLRHGRRADPRDPLARRPRVARPDRRRHGRSGRCARVSVHAFVDETMRGGYYLAAAVMVPSGLTNTRKAINTLLLPGQRRIHFYSERDSRRRQILRTIVDLEPEVVTYDASAHRNDRTARRTCLEALVDDFAARGAHRLIIERDDSRMATINASSTPTSTRPAAPTLSPMSTNAPTRNPCLLSPTPSRGAGPEPATGRPPSARSLPESNEYDPGARRAKPGSPTVREAAGSTSQSYCPMHLQLYLNRSKYGHPFTHRNDDAK